MTPLAEQIYEEIEQTLLHHRLGRWQCADGEGNYPLTDLLTPDGESIQAGYDEIRLMCDAIYNDVLTKHLASSEKLHDVLIQETWNGMPDGYDGFLKTWGFIQFGRRLIEKVLPILTKREPRAWMRVNRTGGSTGVTDTEYGRDQWKRVGDRVVPLYTEMNDEVDYSDLMKFYSVKTAAELIGAMEGHIYTLQAKVPPIPDRFPSSPRHG